MHTFEVPADQTLLEAVVKTMGYRSNSKARKHIKAGFVRVNGIQERMPKKAVVKGDKIEIDTFDRQAVRQNKIEFPFELIHESKDFIAFIKPPGIAIVDDKGKGRSVQRSLRGWLDRTNPDEDLFPVNKVDPPISGIVVACRDARLRTDFEAAMEEARERFYLLVSGRVLPPDGVWKWELKRNKEGQLLPSKPGKDTKEASLTYRTMNGNGEYALLKVESQTKLRHQERGLAAAAGHPIVGDRRYNAPQGPFKRVGMHLFSLEFTSPKGEKISLKTPVPRVFLNCVKSR